MIGKYRPGNTKRPEIASDMTFVVVSLLWKDDDGI